MPRRVSLPAADDLFRPTRETATPSGRPASVRVVPAEGSPEAVAADRPVDEPAAGRPRRTSGRVRHDEKMTVYVTADELLAIEHARLALRRDQGLAVDRGRLVREALAIALADLELNGDDSVLVTRLTDR